MAFTTFSVIPSAALSYAAAMAERVFAGRGAAVAVGGALGALSRHGLALGLPTPRDGFPLATFVTNVLGCLLIGALLVVLTELRRGHHLLRPFLATGVLGGFTTFSTYTVETQQLLSAGRVGTALGYLGGTLLAALSATWIGIALARRLGARPGGPATPGVGR